MADTPIQNSDPSSAQNSGDTERQPVTSDQPGADSTIVIAGASLAGATAAETLRSEGFTGRIVLVGTESHDPYIRPPLSKDYLAGGDLDDAWVKPHDWYAEHDVELVPNVSVTAFDASAHEVSLSDDRRISYSKLLLATGQSPVRPEIPGADIDGVHVIRTIEHSDALRDALKPGGRRVVVVGSGWIGLEVAAAARGYDNDVTVVSSAEVPLSTPIGPELGRVFQKLHEDNGVRFVLGSKVTAIAGGTDGATGVQPDGGDLIPAEVVILGLGASPNVSLAEAAGAEIDGGIVVDASMATSLADVYAAGDVAKAFHPLIDQAIRSEHWANAIEGGRTAAKSMLGQKAQYDAVPYFYTDQYDVGMEFAGFSVLVSDAEVVYRGDVDAREFVSFWLVDDRVVAGMNVNVWDVNEDIQKLVASGRTVDRTRLADPEVPIAEL